MFRILLLLILLVTPLLSLQAQNRDAMDSLQNLLSTQSEPLRKASLLEELSLAQYNNGLITPAIRSLKQSNRIRGVYNSKEKLIDNLLTISSYYQQLNNISMSVVYLRLYSLVRQEYKEGILLNRISDLERLQGLEITALEEQRDRAVAESLQLANQLVDIQKKLNVFQIAAISIFIVFLTGAILTFVYLIRKNPGAAASGTPDPELFQQIQILEKEVNDLKTYLHSGLYLTGQLDDLEKSSENALKKIFPDLLLYNKPRSGSGSNFLWHTIDSNKAILIIGQTNISGLNGSLISILVRKILNHVILEEKIVTPSMVLTLVDQKLRHCIGNESELAYIGCGMTYCLINLAAREMEFAGAGLHLYQIQNKKGNVLKGSLISLANSFAQEKFFNTHRLTITANEGIFLSTSGILDQVGQSEDKRFGRKSFIKLLVTLADKKSSDQYYILDKVHKEWKGMQPQTDDILVVGLRF